MDLNEKLNATADSGAEISRAAQMTEEAHADGKYKVQCLGPAEHEREAYSKVRDVLFAAQAQRTQIDLQIASITAKTPLLRMFDKGLLEELANQALELDKRAWATEMELAKFHLEEKWVEPICNLVTTVGKNLGLDTILAGSSYTASVVMGLKGAGTAVVADTQASHSSWSEVGLANAPTYTGNRKTPAWSSASAGSKATSSAVSFAITSSGTVAGCFLNLAGSATVDNTTGTLYSAGDFTGGSKTVANGDTLNVSYTGSM